MTSLLQLCVFGMSMLTSASRTISMPMSVTYKQGDVFKVKVNYTVPSDFPTPTVDVKFFLTNPSLLKVELTDVEQKKDARKVLLIASYTFKSTDPIGTWKVHREYKNYLGEWIVGTATSVSLEPGVVVTPAPTPTPTPTPVPAPMPTTGLWLTTQGNKILKSDGTQWMARGVNIFDTRGCNACSYNTPNVAEVKRRIDEVVSFGATLLRLNLESYATSGGRISWQPVSQDPQYLADVKSIVDYAASKKDVYVIVSLWIDPSFGVNDVPTAATAEEWKVLAKALKDQPKAIFAICNEPQNNWDGKLDASVWDAMNLNVQAIRDVEAAEGTPNHLVSVQGTRSWARVLEYYLTHPITAGGGKNIVYATHVYDPSSSFSRLFEIPASTLPVIIEEFGPVDWAGMTLVETQDLMNRAEALGVPYTAWSFHMRCDPNMLVDSSGWSCGVNMPLTLTPWGLQIKAQLNKFKSVP